MNFRKIVNILQKIELYISEFGLVVLVGCVFFGAVMRTIGHPLSWPNDIGMMMLAWSTFLGGDIAFRSSRFANLDLIIVKFPLKLQKALAVFIYALIFAFLGIIIVYGFKLTYTSRFRTFNGIPGFSYSWVTASLPVSAVFMFCTAVVRFKRLLTSSDKLEVSKM